MAKDSETDVDADDSDSWLRSSLSRLETSTEAVPLDTLPSYAGRSREKRINSKEASQNPRSKCLQRKQNHLKAEKQMEKENV